MKCSTLMNKLIDKNLIFECCDYQDIRLFYFLKPLDDDRWIIHNNRTSNPNLQISQYTNATNSTCIRNIPPVQFRLSYSSFAITKRGRCAPPFTNSKERPPRRLFLAAQRRSPPALYCLPFPGWILSSQDHWPFHPFSHDPLPFFTREYLRSRARDIHERRSNVEQQVSR